MQSLSRTRVTYPSRYGETLFQAGVGLALRRMIPLAGNDELPDRISTAIQAMAAVDYIGVVKLPDTLAVPISAAQADQNMKPVA